MWTGRPQAGHCIGLPLTDEEGASGAVDLFGGDVSAFLKFALAKDDGV